MIKKILLKAIRIISRFLKSKKSNNYSYWVNRAKNYGVRAVINLGHLETEIDQVTENQKKIIFPILKKLSNGKEETILDFGCGPGRFTKDLGDEMQCKVIGIDPIIDLLDLAPKGENVEYRLIKQNGKFPIESNSIDIVWICLVLGGIITKTALMNCIKEIDRVLKEGGRIILIENTKDAESSEYWKFRTISNYLELFETYKLTHKCDYYDLGERISIFTGFK